MKTIIKYPFLIFINIIVFVFVYYLNIAIIDLRLKEIYTILQQKNKEETDLDHTSLVLKYKMNMKLYKREISLEKAEGLQLDLYLLNKYDKRAKEKIPGKDTNYYIKMLAIKMINLMRFIIGKDPIDAIYEEKSIPEFEIAYYYERNLIYENALEFYDKAMEKVKGINTAKNISGSILLHRGFCHSMVGNFAKAKEYYVEVIEKYSSMKIATTASILLQYLNEFKKEQNIIKKEKNSIEKVEKLYHLLAYKYSIEIINKIKKKIKKKDKVKLQFLEARCLEELNKKEKAVVLYQKLIIANPKDPHSKYSNRRIFLMGEKSKKNTFLSDVALKNNIIVQDPLIKKIVINEKKIIINEKKIINKDKEKDDTISSSSQNKNIIEKEIENEVTLPKIVVKKVKADLKKKSAFKSDGRTYKISTIKGDSMIGKIVNVKGGFIYLKTSFGIAKINSSEIVKKEKIK